MFPITARLPLDERSEWTRDVSAAAAAKTVDADGTTRLLIDTGDTLAIGADRDVWVETLDAMVVYPEQVLLMLGFGGPEPEYADPLLVLHAWKHHGEGVSVDKALTVATTFGAARPLLTGDESLLPMLAHDPKEPTARLAHAFMTDPAFGGTP